MYLRMTLTFAQGTDDSQRSYKHTFKSSHLFTMDDAEWIATEELVMHPTATEDYWKKTDSRNEGICRKTIV